MWTLIFGILFFTVFGKLLSLSFKAAWGISKVLLYLVCLPIILIVLVVCGLFYIAIPALAVVGLVTLIRGKK